MNIFCPSISDWHMHTSISIEGAKNHQAGQNLRDFFFTLVKFYVQEENQEIMIECFVWKDLTLNFLYRKSLDHFTVCGNETSQFS